MAGTFDLANPNRKIHAGVILFDTETELLDIAPFHFIASISKTSSWPEGSLPPHFQDAFLDIDFHWVSGSNKPAILTTGMKVLPTDTFETCPPLDIALMGAGSLSYVPNEAEKAFVRKTFEHCSAFISICAGFQALQHAGLLDGKTLAAPLPMLSELRTHFPETTWLGRRWHQDGKIWSSGTLANGLDAMRAFSLATWGGKQGFTEMLLEIGAWPVRENELREVEVAA